MEVIFVGGYRDTKGLGGVYSVYQAHNGLEDRLLRRKNVHPYKTFANCKLTFIEDANKDGGNLNPLEFAERAKNNVEFPDFTTVYFHEYQRWNDSRNTMRLTGNSNENRLETSYLFDESGKRHFNLILDTQDRGKLDNRIRDGAGYVVKCHNLANDKEFDFPIPYYVVIKDPNAEEEFWQGWEIFPDKKWCEFIFPLYNTWEPPRVHKSEIRVLSEERQRPQTFFKHTAPIPIPQLRVENGVITMPVPELKVERELELKEMKKELKAPVQPDS